MDHLGGLQELCQENNQPQQSVRALTRAKPSGMRPLIRSWDTYVKFSKFSCTKLTIIQSGNGKGIIESLCNCITTN